MVDVEITAAEVKPPQMAFRIYKLHVNAESINCINMI
jgi:hypothetical protein